MKFPSEKKLGEIASKVYVGIIVAVIAIQILIGIVALFKFIFTGGGYEQRDEDYEEWFDEKAQMDMMERYDPE